MTYLHSFDTSPSPSQPMGGVQGNKGTSFSSCIPQDLCTIRGFWCITSVCELIGMQQD